MQQPVIVRLIVESGVCLHNIMRVRYPTLQNAQLDMENQQHDLAPWLWRTTARMHEINRVVGPNIDATVAKREYLQLYFNSPAGSVPWQDRMVTAQ
jgi:hypothetical protein